MKAKREQEELLRMEKQMEALRIQKEENERKRLMNEEKERLSGGVKMQQHTTIIPDPNLMNTSLPSANALYPANNQGTVVLETKSAGRYNSDIKSYLLLEP